MHANLADEARIGEPEMRPAMTSIGTSVDAIAMGDIDANGRFAGAGINHIRIGRSDRERSDRAGRQKPSVTHFASRCLHRPFSRRRRHTLQNRKCFRRGSSRTPSRLGRHETGRSGANAGFRRSGWVRPSLFPFVYPVSYLFAKDSGFTGQSEAAGVAFVS